MLALAAAAILASQAQVSIASPATPLTQIAPDDSSTLGDFMVAVQRLFQLPRATESVEFTDVPSNSPLIQAVEAVSPYLGRQTLCAGCALGTNLLPNQPLSRAQMAVVIVNVLVAQKKLDLPGPAETDSVLRGMEALGRRSAPVRPYLAAAFENGLLEPKPGNRIALSTPVSRAELAAALGGIQHKYSLTVASYAP